MPYNSEAKYAALLDIQAVTSATSLSKATISRLMREGRFPTAVTLTPGGRRVAWKCDEVNDWIAFPAAWPEPIDF